MKTVAVFLSNRATYYRHQVLLYEMESLYNLHIFVTSSLLDKDYSNTLDEIQTHFKNVHKLPLKKYKSTLNSMAFTTGTLLTNILQLCETLPRFDAWMVIADRFELMAPAIVASYQHIPLIHLQGGEVSSNIDNKVRHAISAMADLHLVSHYKAKIRLGQYTNVYNTGCPSIDLIVKNDIKRSQSDSNYAIVIYHPHTNEDELTEKHTLEVIQNVQFLGTKTGLNIYWFAPNNDPSSKLIKLQLTKSKFNVIYNLPGIEFLKLLANARMIIGNSSAGIREASFLGVPSITIGRRQENRDCAENVINADYHNMQETFLKAYHTKCKPSTLFGNGHATESILKHIGEFLNGKQN